MDLSYASINKGSNELKFSRLYNPVIIIRDGTINELKADRQPMEIYEIEHPFSAQIFQLESRECIYLFSDGFQDQIGGPDHRKYKPKSLKEIWIRTHVPFSLFHFCFTLSYIFPIMIYL